MQKNKIDIQREILDDFLNLSYVIKTMTNLECKYSQRKNNAFESNYNKEMTKKQMIYKKENDWLFNEEKEEENAQNIWEKFKKLNVNAESFNPLGAKSKSLKIESEQFLPQK